METTIHKNLSSILLHYALYRGKTKPRSFDFVFCGEEGFKNMRHNFLIHPALRYQSLSTRRNDLLWLPHEIADGRGQSGHCRLKWQFAPALGMASREFKSKLRMITCSGIWEGSAFDTSEVRGSASLSAGYLLPRGAIACGLNR